MATNTLSTSSPKFDRGQSVTGRGRYGGTRYTVERRHRDGTCTVRAQFNLDAAGRDQAGYLGFRYRVPVSALEPLEREHPLSRTVRRYRAAGRAPVAMEG